MKKLFTYLLLLCCSLISAKAQETATYTLEIVIENVKHAQGSIGIALFNSEETFLTKSFKKTKVKPSPAGNVTVTFEDLPAGEYAFSVLHDLNDNGDLDMGQMGPLEPYGFSNNAPSMYGPAQYSQAKFELRESMTTSVKIM